MAEDSTRQSERELERPHLQEVEGDRRAGLTCEESTAAVAVQKRR